MPQPASLPRCSRLSDHLLCMFAVAALTSSRVGAPPIGIDGPPADANATHAAPYGSELDRACMARATAIRSHVLASGADPLPHIMPGCRAAATSMRDPRCVLRDGCSLRTCAHAGFAITADDAAHKPPTAMTFRGGGGGGLAAGSAALKPWWARPDHAKLRPIVAAPTESAAARLGASAAGPAVEEEAPAFIREALRHDRNTLNGLPAGWPGV